MSASTSSASASLSVHAQCEFRAVIRFLHTRGETPAAIHRQLCTSYGSTSMSIKNVRKWCREFSNGRTNIHDEARSGRPSVSDNLQEQPRPCPIGLSLVHQPKEAFGREKAEFRRRSEDCFDGVIGKRGRRRVL
ncbi:hypothetical protein QTP88_003377 [Uroleucon formosanum]